MQEEAKNVINIISNIKNFGFVWVVPQIFIVGMSDNTVFCILDTKLYRLNLKTCFNTLPANR